MSLPCNSLKAEIESLIIKKKYMQDPDLKHPSKSDPDPKHWPDLRLLAGGRL